MADQFDIDNLVRQLQDLVPALKDLSRTPATGGGGSSGADRIVTAIAKLNASITKQTRSKAQETKSIEKFTKDIDDAAEAAKNLADQQRQAADAKKKQDEELAEAQKRAAMSAEELAKYNEKLAADARIADALSYRQNQESKKREIKTAGALIDEYGRGVTGTAALREKFDSLGGTSVAANMGFRLLSSGAEALAKSFVEYSKAVYQGKQGAAVAAKSVNTFAQGLGTTAQVLGGIVALIPGFQALGIGVFAAGTGLKAVGNYAETAAEMSDRLFGTYQDLSKVGASSADGMRGLGESAVRLGYGLDEVGLKAFSDLISKSSTDLALLSGTVMQGRQDFVNFGETITRGPVGRGLMNMGMKVEDINEGLASYVGLQARVGQAQNKTTAQLQIGAAAYLKEMDGLTKLTGIQRSEMEQSINKARAVEQFRAKTEAMRASGDERQIAAADQMERYFAVLSKQAPELAQGYAESASGLITSPAGIKFFQTIGSATGVVQGLSSGAMTAVDAYDQTNKAAKEFTVRFNSLGQAGVVAASGFGNFVEAANLGARANQDLVKSAEDITAAQQKQIAGADGVVASQVDLRREQMNTRDSLQKLVEIGIKPTTKAMQGFASFVESITGVPGKVAPGAKPAGAKMSTGGAPAATGQPSSEQQILDFIGRYESGGNYNRMVGGATAPLTEMTVADVLQFQGQRVAQGQGSAAGKYQIIQRTLQGLVNQGVVSPTDQFNSATQDRLGVALLNQSGYAEFKSGKISKDTFADRLAGVWAALPMASGQSRYEGQNGNRALVGREEFLGAIGAKFGGIIPARPGGTRLVAAEAGMNEAFVPLPDGKTIPVTVNFAEVLSKSGSGFADIVQQLQSTVNSQVNVEAMTQAFRAVLTDVVQQRVPGSNTIDTQLVQLMSEMVRLQGANNSTAQRLLQVSTA